MTEALAVLEKQLSDQRSANKPKAVGGDGSGITEVARTGATPAVLGLLNAQVNSWRSLACKRLMALPSYTCIDGMQPLAVLQNAEISSTCANNSLVAPSQSKPLRPQLDIATNIYWLVNISKIGNCKFIMMFDFREARRRRARTAVIAVAQSSKADGTSKPVPRTREGDASVVALRLRRELRSSENLAISMRSTLAHFVDENSAFKARRNQQ